MRGCCRQRTTFRGACSLALLHILLNPSTHPILAKTEKGLTQKQVAEKANIPHTTYSNYENGNRQPNELQVKKIAQALNVSSEYLYTVKELEDADNHLKQEIEEIIERCYDELRIKTMLSGIKLQQSNNMNYEKFEIEVRNTQKSLENLMDKFKKDLTLLLADMKKHFQIGDFRIMVENGFFGELNKESISEITNDLGLYSYVHGYALGKWENLLETTIKQLTIHVFFGCMQEDIDVKKVLLEKISQMENEDKLKEILFEIY